MVACSARDHGRGECHLICCHMLSTATSGLNCVLAVSFVSSDSDPCLAQETSPFPCFIGFKMIVTCLLSLSEVTCPESCSSWAGVGPTVTMDTECRVIVLC